MIERQKNYAARQREEDHINRQMRTKQFMAEKLGREADEHRQAEMEVARMEKEELELIMRLKNTKLLEDEAHKELKTALEDENPGALLAQKSQQ